MKFLQRCTREKDSMVSPPQRSEMLESLRASKLGSEEAETDKNAQRKAPPPSPWVQSCGGAGQSSGKGPSLPCRFLINLLRLLSRVQWMTSGYEPPGAVLGNLVTRGFPSRKPPSITHTSV